MKKFINKFVTLVISFAIFLNPVFAADFNYTITSKDLTVGSSVTLTIDGTGSGLTGRFNVTSSNSGVATVSASSVWIENNRQTITITAKKAGTTNITIIPTDGISDANANAPKLNPKSITITVKDKPVVVETPSNNTTTNNNRTVVQAKPKSSNNFLTSLSVTGLTLNETFDKEKLEYTITAPAETEKVTINAQLADSSAKVTGLGEKNVKVGLNTFEIVVTAENGNKKTYKLNITVKELTPIIVNIDNSEYTVVKKKEELPEISEYYELKEIEINNESVPAYYNDTLKYTLVALKDKDNKINYYIYKNNKYTLYKEYRFGGTTLQVLDKELPTGYKKTNFKYGKDTITSYQEVKLDIIKNTYALEDNEIIGNQYYLFYGKNIETGKENLYQYDANEKTIQRYNTELLDMYKKTADTYYMYILVLLLVIAVLIFLLAILSIKNGKLKKQNKLSKKEFKLKKNKPSKDEENDEEE